jgi:outer membrane lipoprotein-sorting protein
MILKKSLFSVFLLLMISSGYSVGGECPEIRKLREFYQQRRFIKLEFIQMVHSDIFETVDTLSGALWAGGGKSFRLTMPDQVLVSNGILYWSYSVENQQVLVDSVAKLGDWNPLTLLYDPEQVYGCRNQRQTTKELEFEMEAVDSLTVPREFVMQISKSGYVPRKLVYYDDNESKIEVRIKDFSRPDSLPDSLFDFRPGPEVEVIEMP